jgi:hypothetical protein
MQAVQNYYYDPTLPLRDYLFAVRGNPDFPAPPNSRRVAPDITAGVWAGERDGTWVYFESHRGRAGYVNGKPYTITDHGPLPEGWSDTPPPPTPEELEARREAEFNAAINQRLQNWIADHGWDSLDRVLGQTGVFADDARIVQAAYDATWQAALPLFADVISGDLSIADALALLPALVWPEAFAA